jgi:L-threonylcarbamoyladenylate synthase
MTKELPIAIDIITKGGILLYPTDTVYGLGCDARDEKAIERIAKLKNRATNKSYIILVNYTLTVNLTILFDKSS